MTIEQRPAVDLTPGPTPYSGIRNPKGARFLSLLHTTDHKEIAKLYLVTSFGFFSPPPRHNFTSIPRIRSERPAFEAHYPELLARLNAESHAGPL